MTAKAKAKVKTKTVGKRKEKRVAISKQKTRGKNDKELTKFGFVVGTKRDAIATLMATGKYTKKEIQKKCKINYSLGKTIKALKDNNHIVEINDKDKITLKMTRTKL